MKSVNNTLSELNECLSDYYMDIRMQITKYYLVWPNSIQLIFAFACQPLRTKHFDFLNVI